MNRTINTASKCDIIGNEGRSVCPHQPLRLHYTRKEPHQVLIRIGTEEVPWTFGRELLADGLNAGVLQPAGCGDVQIWHQGTAVILHLTGDDGEVRVEIPRQDVIQFLNRTYTLVPRGSEHVEISDEDLALLVG